MGTVYRALDKQTGKTVALKTLTADHGVDVTRLTREAEVLARLAHPGIVAYVAHGVTPDGVHYLVEDFIEGLTLAQKALVEGFSHAEAIDAVARVAAALGAAH